LQLWLTRTIFGAKFLDYHYSTWFAINNLATIVVMVVGVLFIMFLMSKRRRFASNRFAAYEKHHPKMTLVSLYMIPVGAVFINSFLIGFLLAFAYLNFGFSEFAIIASSLFPHGINEILALLFASSLGLAYLKIIEPLVLKNKLNEAIQIGKKLIFSRTTFYILAFIIILILFSAFLEGREIALLTK